MLLTKEYRKDRHTSFSFKGEVPVNQVLQRSHSAFVLFLVAPRATLAAQNYLKSVCK